jgi:benzodiazapine receptor
MGKVSAIDIAKLAGSILVCQAAGIVGAVFTTPAIPTWYVTLNKPPFTPPGWLFGPVWFSLYTLMGIAAFLVWRRGFNVREVRIALTFFGVQLILNAVWSVLFFGLKSPLAGFIDLVLLWLAIVIVILQFSRISVAAGLLLIPYILWVSFAGILNFSIFILNR